MSERPQARFIDGALTFLIGTLVGALATFSMFSGRLTAVETKLEALDKKVDQIIVAPQLPPRRIGGATS